MNTVEPGNVVRVTLSTSSVYPLGVEAAFETAARLGYDGVEVMVLSDPLTYRPDLLQRWSEHHGVPITSIHAPCLLVTQRVWGTADPWIKLDRSIELAAQVGADAVVVHPPFRWQKGYAERFAEGVAEREEKTGMDLAVENMFPWRTGNREMLAYLPHWDPVPQPYSNVTLDLSHAATAGSDVLDMQAKLGKRLRHIHLADGSGSFMDEHLVPGRGGQPCDEFLRRLTENGFDGDVCLEVSTRKRSPEMRAFDLRESLHFARLYLGQEGSEAPELPHGHHRSRTSLAAGSARRREVRADRKARRVMRRGLRRDGTV